MHREAQQPIQFGVIVDVENEDIRGRRSLLFQGGGKQFHIFVAYAAVALLAWFAENQPPIAGQSGNVGCGERKTVGRILEDNQRTINSR